MTSPALEARNVSKAFNGGVQALSGVSLAVQRHETVAVVGESGSGKTTLLRLFNRLVEPSQGDVWIHGKPAQKLDAVHLRRQTGYVHQQSGLLPHWSVKRNVELVPKLLQWSPDRRLESAERMLELVGLPPRVFAHRYPSELSGGQQQRVALARALAAEPAVLLMDEPFGALDAITRARLRRQFARMQRELGITVVLVTHDLTEAAELATRVAVMRAGEILQAGSMTELEQHPEDPYVSQLIEEGT